MTEIRRHQSIRRFTDVSKWKVLTAWGRRWVFGAGIGPEPQDHVSSPFPGWRVRSFSIGSRLSFVRARNQESKQCFVSAPPTPTHSHWALSDSHQSPPHSHIAKESSQLTPAPSLSGGCTYVSNSSLENNWNISHHKIQWHWAPRTKDYF